LYTFPLLPYCNTYDIFKLEKRNLLSLFFFVREEQRDTGFSHEQKTVKVKIRNRAIIKRTSRVCPLLGQFKHYDSTKGVSLLQLQSCWESEPRYISVILFYVFRVRTGRTRRTWTKDRTERTNVDERDRRDGRERTTDADGRGGRSVAHTPCRRHPRRATKTDRRNGEDGHRRTWTDGTGISPPENCNPRRSDNVVAVTNHMLCVYEWLSPSQNFVGRCPDRYNRFSTFRSYFFTFSASKRDVQDGRGRT